MVFLFFLFWKELWRFKVKESMLFAEQKYKVNKTRPNRKWKIPYTVLERWTMSFSLYENCESKVKLWWVVACKRKKNAFFVTFILSKGNFFNILVLSHWIVYWINFQNIYTFTYQKTLLHTLLLLVFKIFKSLQLILLIIVPKNLVKINLKFVEAVLKSRESNNFKKILYKTLWWILWFVCQQWHTNIGRHVSIIPI